MNRIEIPTPESRRLIGSVVEEEHGATATARFFAGDPRADCRVCRAEACQVKHLGGSFWACNLPSQARPERDFYTIAFTPN